MHNGILSTFQDGGGKLDIVIKMCSSYINSDALQQILCYLRYKIKTWWRYTSPKYCFNEGYEYEVILCLKVKNDHRSNFPIEEIGKKKPEKIRASTGFGPATSAIPVRYQLSYEVTGSEVNLLSSYLPCGVKWCEVYMKSYLSCGCKWKWRMIIAVNFQEFGVRFRIRSVVWNSECTCRPPYSKSRPILIY